MSCRYCGGDSCGSGGGGSGMCNTKFKVQIPVYKNENDVRPYGYMMADKQKYDAYIDAIKEVTGHGPDKIKFILSTNSITIH